MFNNVFGAAKKWLLSRSRAVGVMRLRESRFSEAARVLKMVVNLGEGLSDDRDMIADLISLGVAHQALGQQLEADLVFERVVELADKMAATNSPDSDNDNGMQTIIAADLLADRGRFDQAELLLRRSIMRAQEKEGDDSRLEQIYLGRLASAYTKQGLRDAAEDVYQRLVAMAERSEPGSKNLAAALSNLAWHLANCHQYDRAELLFRQAIDVLEKLPFEASFGRVSTEVLTLHGLASIERVRNRRGNAVKLYQRAVETLDRLAEPNHDYLTRLLESLALSLKEDGRPEEANVVEQRLTVLRAQVNKGKRTGSESGEEN